jgi:hypothetical protein
MLGDEGPVTLTDEKFHELSSGLKRHLQISP